MRWPAVPLVVALCAGLAVGCASTDTRNLTEKELDVLNRLQERIRENRGALDGSLADLQAIAGQALADQHSLSSSISKAQLLESMKSPWVNPRPDLAATQKEVAFYHLYALSEAERDLLDSRLRERKASADEVSKAYLRMLTLVAKSIEAEKVILAHLNRPAKAQFGGVLSALLGETQAFRQSLAQSENPRLQALAAEVAKAEGKVTKAQDLINQALAAAAATAGKE